MAANKWARPGRKCYHMPTRQQMIVASILPGNRLLLIKPGDRKQRISAHPGDVWQRAPVAYKPRRRKVVPVHPLLIAVPDNDSCPFTDEENQTAAAWGMSPVQVRRIRREGRHV